MQTLASVKHDTIRTRERRGLAILAGLFVAAALIFNLDLIVDQFRGYVDVVALVTETSGVRIGAPVAVEGVEAGRVTAIDFVDLGGAGALALHIRLGDEFQSVVRQGSRARTARERFIGAPSVRITAGPPEAPPIQDGDTIYPDVTVTLESLLERGMAVPEVLDSLNDAVTALNRLASARRPAIGRLMERVNVVTAEAGALQTDMSGGSLDRFLNDPAFGQRVTRLRERVAQLSEAAAAMSARYQDPELRAGIESVSLRAQRLGQTLDELQTNMAEGGGGFIPRAARDSALAVAIQGVQAQIDSLRAAGLGFAAEMVLP